MDGQGRKGLHAPSIPEVGGRSGKEATQGAWVKCILEFVVLCRNAPGKERLVIGALELLVL